MKKIVKWILTVMLFAGMIAMAAVLYNNLSKNYAGDSLSTDFGDFIQAETKRPQQTMISGTNHGKDHVGTETTNSVSKPTESETVQSTVPPNSGVNRPLAPDFTVLDENGNEVRLSDYRGKPVVLNFWATWCYYCKVEMPDFNQAYQKYPDVQFLMVNATDGVQDTVEGVKAFIEDNGYEFDVFFDTEYNAVYAYHITGFPATFFINENGYLITRASGRLNAESLERGIEMITQTEK